MTVNSTPIRGQSITRYGPLIHGGRTDNRRVLSLERVPRMRQTVERSPGRHEPEWLSWREIGRRSPHAAWAYSCEVARPSCHDAHLTRNQGTRTADDDPRC